MLDLIVLFAKGFLIGISLAVVIGPIALLCMQQTVAHGLSAGIACGLGVATADGIYSALTVLCITFITNILHTHQFWFRLGGGFLLLYLGYTIFNRRIMASPLPPTSTRLVNLYISTCFLTLTNPMTLIPLSALCVSFELTDYLTYSFVIPTIALGVFSGSMTWWIILCSGVSFFRSRISANTLTTMNKIAGFLIALFGIGVLASLYVWC